MEQVFEQLGEYLLTYQHLPQQDLQKIFAISKVLHLSKNEILQPIGKSCRNIYFINKGLARIYYYKDGLDITEGFAFEKNLAVRFESLFTGQPSRKGIQVLEDTKVIAISASELEKLYDVHPLIERLFRKLFEACHVETINRIETIQFHTAEERYKHLLQEAPDVIKRVQLKYIASYLGITQVSLSRIRSSK